MATTIQPVIITADLNRLLAFYSGLFGATQTSRVPDDGPAFFVGLRIGDSEMGLVANAEGAAGAASRILLSVAVENVDSMLERVKALGGSVRGQPNNMPWGQRVAHIADPDGNTRQPHAASMRRSGRTRETASRATMAKQQAIGKSAQNTSAQFRGTEPVQPPSLCKTAPTGEALRLRDDR